MSTLSEVAKNALALDDRERLTLARMLLELTDSEDSPQTEIDAEWDKEIHRRIEAIKAGTVKGKPLDSVMKSAASVINS